MTEPLVVEVDRSGFVESTHLVDVAVVDATGALIASAGDPERPGAFRSSAKPIQARAALAAGWKPPDDRCLALACASHNGEDEHVAVARRTLAHAGVPEDALRCPADLPFEPDALLRATERRAVTHNCSGKHAAMLAACAAAGWSLEGYREPDHPLQQAITDHVAQLCGVRGELLVDGCGVPTMVAPLAAFARAFLAIDDGGPEATAMRAHPFLVGGTKRFDSDLMTIAPHLLTKAGAEGLSCVAAAGIGIAVKARDGAARPRSAAVLHVLRQLGLIDDEARARLVEHDRPAVSGGGRAVGEVRAIGSIRRN